MGRKTADPVQYAYDANGQRVEMYDSTGDTEYTYDDRGYIVAETAMESLAGYAYDDKHNGKHTDGKHDDLYPHGTKHTKHDKDAAFAYQIVQTDRTFVYDAVGKLISATETEDNYGTYTYTYEYDLMGNRSAMTKRAEDGTVAQWYKYVYNDSNQLVKEELYDGKKTITLTYTYDEDGNRISEVGKIGTDRVEKYYEYTVENRLAAVYDADELLMAAVYDGDGNRVFQLNYNLHTDEDQKGNSGNGNGNNKDNKGSGNNGKGSSSNGKGNSKSEGTDDAGYGNATNAEANNSQNQSGILFPIDSEVSTTEQSLIDKIKTTGKQKNYELMEYINDVNREYAEVLVKQNINGKTDTSYIYGVDRLSLDRFDGNTGYYLYDPRGSVSGITNEEGQIYQSYRYSVTGEITFGAPQYENEYTYNGESYNPNIKSQYLRARYYDVVAAVFLTEDSYLGDINEPLTLNRYNYCVSNPLNYVEPSGNNTDLIDYNAVYDSLMYMIKGEEYEEQFIQNSKDRRSRNEWEMAFNLGIIVSVMNTMEDSILAPLAEVGISLFNQTLPPYTQIDEQKVVQEILMHDIYVNQKVSDSIDLNAYYSGRCGGDVIVIVTDIATMKFAVKGAAKAVGSGTLGINISIPMAGNQLALANVASIPLNMAAAGTIGGGYVGVLGIAGNDLFSNFAKVDKSGWVGSNDTGKCIYKPNDGRHKSTAQGDISEDPFCWNNQAVGQEYLDSAYSSKNTKQLYNVYNNKLVKFQPDNAGTWHAYEVINSATEVPADVLRNMRDDGLITKTQYNKWLKGK